MFPVKIEICPYIYLAQAKSPGKRLVFMRIIAFSGTSGQFCQRPHIGFTVNTFPLEVTDSYAKGVVLSTQDYSTFWVRTATHVNDLPNSSSGTTVSTLTNRAIFGYIGLKTPEHNGFVCWDQNTNLYEWWSIDGSLIKTLDYKPDSEYFVYRYKNGKIYRSILGSVTLNQYVESNFKSINNQSKTFAIFNIIEAALRQSNQSNKGGGLSYEPPPLLLYFNRVI